MKIIKMKCMDAPYPKEIKKIRAGEWAIRQLSNGEILIDGTLASLYAMKINRAKDVLKEYKIKTRDLDRAIKKAEQLKKVN